MNPFLECSTARPPQAYGPNAFSVLHLTAIHVGLKIYESITSPRRNRDTALAKPVARCVIEIPLLFARLLFDWPVDSPLDCWLFWNR